MALAVWACKTSTQAKNELVEGWVSLEDNQQCINLLAEEIVQLMDLKVLCQLKEMLIEGPRMRTLWMKPNQGNQLLLMRYMHWQSDCKNLQVQTSQLGGEYHAVALAVGNDYDNLLSINHKNKNRKLSTNGQD
jgi:hypothetical protein